MTTLLLYHWSPRANRESIETHGLLPGQRANDGDWNPPHVCLADTADQALTLCHGSGPLDLWVVERADCADLTRVDSEWRTREPAPAKRMDRAYRCPDCPWHQKPHPDYGWQPHDDRAVEVHKTRFCRATPTTTATTTEGDR